MSSTMISILAIVISCLTIALTIYNVRQMRKTDRELQAAHEIRMGRR